MNLIIGGTGSLGSALTRRLLAKRMPVRVMTRTPEKAAELKGLGAEVRQGDLLDKTSLARACKGATKVVAAAHSILGRGKESSRHVDLQGHKDLIDAAKAAEVTHFVYISLYDFGPEYESVPFLVFKREVERYLKASGLNYTILRPTAFMESHAHFFIGQSILESGKVTLFGRGENLRNFVAADDAAYFAEKALEDQELIGATIDIGGPEDLTNMDVVRFYEQLAGREAKVSHVPLAMLKVMYRVLRPFHPGLSQIMQSIIHADTVDCTFDTGPMLARYPIKLTTLEEWAAERIQCGALSPAMA